MRSISLVILGLMCLGSAAHAAELSEPELRFLEAANWVQKGQLEKAIAALEEALNDDRDQPVLIYNLAVLNDQAGNSEKAIRLYEKYLEGEPDDGDFIDHRLRQLRPEPEPDPEPKIKLVAPSIPTPEPPMDVAPRGTTINTWALLGVGVASLAFGGAFGVMTVQDVDALMAARVRTEADGFARQARNHQLYANISYGVGVGACVAAIVSAFMDRMAEPAGPPKP